MAVETVFPVGFWPDNFWPAGFWQTRGFGQVARPSSGQVESQPVATSLERPLTLHVENADG